MSDAAEPIAPVVAAAEGGSDAPAESVEVAPTTQAGAPEIVSESATKTGDANEPGDVQIANMDEDSEAETLIQSPEKRRNDVDAAPRLESSGPEDLREGESTGRMVASPSDGKTRKRKRNETDLPDTESPNRRASSHRSSPLSSPVPDTKAEDTDSDISSPHSRIHLEDSATSNQDVLNGDRSGEPEKKRARTSGQPRLRKRRPSDIPTQDLQHRSTRQKQSLDASSNQDRRETRSATYPRQSSTERSVSPEPVRRREHRRVASTQIGSSIALTKKRRAPAPLITTSLSRRNRSADRQSVSSEASSSPAPSRPALHKYNSTELDAMSPAKGPTGPRKFRDKNGRTHLARACASDDLDAATARFEERPEDLNIADFAGNTPLQIAALDGFVDLVKFLLNKNCEVNTKNEEGDTPLIDAVENGHLEIVKLLLEHGANPRLANKSGSEPYELVKSEDEHEYSEIRRLLESFKLRDTQRRESDDQTPVNKESSSRAASAASPRDSPPLHGPRSPPPHLTSRRRTGRSEFTRNDLLWQANTQENLTKLAGRGDVQGVASILNILQKAETESLVAAAKGGHDEVLQYLLGMGNPDPDPDPIRSERFKTGFNTPMLAAIGRGNMAVVKLLVEQSGFNPTREIRGRTYPDYSQDRKGVNWQEEHRILKAAYDDYKGPKARKHTSPRKSRDLEKDGRRQGAMPSSPLPSQRKSLRSPEQSHKDIPGKNQNASREVKREVKREPFGSSQMPDEPRKKIRDPNSGDHNVAVSSDHDANGDQPKTHKTRRSQSDLHTADSENIQKNRRRLVTGREHRRRASAANVDAESGDESAIEVKKRAPKRSRDSLSPERPPSRDSDNVRLSVKERRTVQDSSPEEIRSAKSSNRGAETLGVGQRKTLSNKNAHNPDDTAKVLNDVDEIFKRNQQKQPEQGPHQTRRASVQKMEDVEPTVQTRQPDDIAKEAELQAKALAEKEAAANAERLVKEQEAKRLQAEKEAADLARQIEEEKLAAERRKAEEAAAKKKAEEDAIARKREEEERVERLKREAEERHRRQEERRQREFQEIERRRQDALPSRLRMSAIMLDQNDPQVRSHTWLSEMLPLHTVKSSQIIPGLEHMRRGLFEEEHPDDEEWIPNFQAAYLLATKDLNLRSYTSLERRPVTEQEKDGLWRNARNKLYYDYHATSINTTIPLVQQKEREERPKFMAMQDVFWVKVSRRSAFHANAAPAYENSP